MMPDNVLGTGERGVGLIVDQERFLPADYRRFSDRLEESLRALETLLERPGWGVGPTTVGAELELVLVAPDGTPRWCNEAVAKAACDRRVGLEMARWDL
jgi:hypothetical protein